MKIITIGREFGSGGRELGKRLADILGYEYYDREIITAISNSKGLKEDFVESVLENGMYHNYPISYGHSFGVGMVMHNPHISLFGEQRKVIEKIAESGKDCIIVGRNADIILKKYKPFNIFVCAAEEYKLERCLKRATDDEKLSAKQILRKMKRIDKNRANLRNFISNSKWGDPEAYDLTVNSSGWEMKKLAPIVAEYIRYSIENKSEN